MRVPARLIDYLLAPSTVVITAASGLLLRTDLEPATQFIFVLPVAVSGWLGGFGPGLLATLLSLVAVEALFLPAPDSILTGNTHDLARIALFLFVGVLVSWINHAMRQARRAAEAERTRYRQLAEALPQIVFVTRPDGSVSWCNRWWFELTGLSAKEVDTAGGWQHVIHPEDLPNLVTLYGSTPLEPHSYEYRVRRAADGEYRWHLGRSLPLTGPEGQYEGRVGVAADIHEQKRTEALLRDQAAELRASEERFRTMADTLPQLVWTADAGGAMQWYNQRWTQYLGRPPASLERLSRAEWEHLVHHEDVARLDRAWENAVQAGQRFECEYRIRRASDGAWRWHLSRATPVRDAAGQVRQWVGTSTDIHDQKLAEELVRDQKLLLEQLVTERTAELTRRTHELTQSHAQMADYAHTIAHDLRAPLRAMRGYIDVLFEEHVDQLGPRGVHYGTRIAQAAERMNALLEDLLAYNRAGQGPISSAAFALPGAVVSAVAQLESEIAGRQARVAVEVPEAHGVLGHEPTCVQAIANLIANGLKFVADGVRPEVRVWSELHGKRVRLWVSDNGIGIAPEHQDRVFRIFERIHPSYPGTGVGLAMVQRSVERMGGRCGLESTPGEGSRFWIELPAAEPPAGRTDDAARVATAVAR
ncbi:MAG TPA: PAS domain-containing protein [Candidatus Eisenbacteria bacterium]|nr:PAS domain-containing protein [Candidatus Eisenbacteria bacterium]